MAWRDLETDLAELFSEAKLEYCPSIGIRCDGITRFTSAPWAPKGIVRCPHCGRAPSRCPLRGASLYVKESRLRRVSR